MKRLLVLMLVASCDAGTPPKQPTAPPGPPAPPPPTAPPAGSSAGSAIPVTGQAKVSIYHCVEDKQARAACVAKGGGWQYSDPPPRDCSGVERPPQAKAPPPPPCECIQTADYQRQVIECSQVP